MNQGKMSVEKQFSAALNQLLLVFPRPEWQEEVKEILSKCLYFYVQNIDIVNHSIRDETELHNAKEIAKQDSLPSRAQHFIRKRAVTNKNALEHKCTNSQLRKKPMEKFWLTQRTTQIQSR